MVEGFCMHARMCVRQGTIPSKNRRALNTVAQKNSHDIGTVRCELGEMRGKANWVKQCSIAIIQNTVTRLLLNKLCRSWWSRIQSEPCQRRLTRPLKKIIKMMTNVRGWWCKKEGKKGIINNNKNLAFTRCSWRHNWVSQESWGMPHFAKIDSWVSGESSYLIKIFGN